MTDRYSRQVLFATIGAQGQARIGSSRVALIGCGALGTVSAEMLVRAGIGQLTIVDRDFVEESNLQRQTLFTESHASVFAAKASAAVEALSSVNSEVEISGIVADASFVNIRQLVAGCDLIIDGTDNFETRYLINDVAVEQGVPGFMAAPSAVTVLRLRSGLAERLVCAASFQTRPPPERPRPATQAGLCRRLSTLLRRFRSPPR